MKAAHPEVVTAQRVNPGESLREARESKGWAVDEVAAQLNLTPLRLSQIEAGAFDKLPGNTFARGYVRAYAKLLGMDQSRLVLEFDQFTGSDAVGSDVHSLGHIEEPVRYSQSILRFVSFALLVVLAGVGFYWWQEQAERHAAESPVTSIEQVEVDGADGTTQIHPLDEPEDQAVLAAQGATELSLSPAPAKNQQSLKWIALQSRQRLRRLNRLQKWRRANRLRVPLRPPSVLHRPTLPRRRPLRRVRAWSVSALSPTVGHR